MFYWKYNALIYCRASGDTFYDKNFDSYEEAQKAIEENIDKYASESFPPTGHINKDYIQVD